MRSVAEIGKCDQKDKTGRRNLRPQGLLAVSFEEPAKFADRHFQLINAWQRHDTDVIRLRPVECCPLNQQDFLLQQQIQHQFLIVMNVKTLGINSREHIQRTFRFHA